MTYEEYFGAFYVKFFSKLSHMIINKQENIFNVNHVLPIVLVNILYIYVQYIFLYHIINKS